MTTRGPAIVWGVLAFVIGALPAFALAGPAFFTQAPASRHWQALAMYGAGLFVVSVGGGAIAGTRRLAVSIGLAMPAIAVLLLATWGPVETYALAVAFVVVAGVAAWAGTWVGVRLTAAALARRKR